MSFWDWGRKRSADGSDFRAKFCPEPDITVHELAQIVKGYHGGYIWFTPETWAGEASSLQRHFKREER